MIRVFPRKIKQTPKDGRTMPGLFDDKREPVHISVTFTWDIPEAERLAEEWRFAGFENVKVGGPALDDPGGEFVPGRYLSHGNVITSRGCPNNCDFCLVPKREGKLRELEIKEGNAIHDNNILACSQSHWETVIAMLRTQKNVRFVGGLEAARLKDHHVEDIRSLHLDRLYFAYDRAGARNALIRVIQKCSPYFYRAQLRCFVLIGREPIEEARARLEDCWNLGFAPFAMLYQPPHEFIAYSKEWRALQREFVHPAITGAVMRTKEPAQCCAGQLTGLEDEDELGTS